MNITLLYTTINFDAYVCYIFWAGGLVYLINLCYVMVCYVMLCYVMLCYVMLCYVMLCYVMLCYVMLCYVMLCYVCVHLLGSNCSKHNESSIYYYFVKQSSSKSRIR